jgi:hypothetical protein
MVNISFRRSTQVDDTHELNRYLRQLNIDKDILSMKNFNIYDPMKRGQGLVLDGQTLAHLEASMPLLVIGPN